MAKIGLNIATGNNSLIVINNIIPTRLHNDLFFTLITSDCKKLNTFSLAKIIPSPKAYETFKIRRGLYRNSLLYSISLLLYIIKYVIK